MTDVLHDPAAGPRGADNDEPFGWHLAIDLKDCDPDKIGSGDHIRAYAVQLCDDVIHMKRFGETIVEHFGHANPKTSGFSLFQMIETSNITAHFSEDRGSAHFDVFSCLWYDPDAVIAFTLQHFGGRLRHQVFLERR